MRDDLGGEMSMFMSRTNKQTQTNKQTNRQTNKHTTQTAASHTPIPSKNQISPSNFTCLQTVLYHRTTSCPSSDLDGEVKIERYLSNPCAKDLQIASRKILPRRNLPTNTTGLKLPDTILNEFFFFLEIARCFRFGWNCVICSGANSVA